MRQNGRTSLYVLTAVCAASGAAVGLITPELNTAVVNLFLEQFSRQLAPGVHAVLLWDGAGYHVGKDLVVPANVSLIRLLPYSPELNPVENLWHYLRAHYWSHRVYPDYEALLEAATETWRTVCWTRRRSGRSARPPIWGAQIILLIRITCPKTTTRRPTSWGRLQREVSTLGSDPFSGDRILGRKTKQTTSYFLVMPYRNPLQCFLWTVENNRTPGSASGLEYLRNCLAASGFATMSSPKFTHSFNCFETRSVSVVCINLRTSALRISPMLVKIIAHLLPDGVPASRK